MSENTPTPGPWRYQEGQDAYTHIVRYGDCGFLCQLAQDRSGRAEANARLIAAAPDLLAAARSIIELHDELSDELDEGKIIEDAFDRWDEAVDRLIAAVATATGGARK